MKPVKFKHCNATFAEGQEDYQKLPALVIETDERPVISCFSLSFVERLQVLIFGRVWLCLLTFGAPLQPVKISPYRDKIYTVINHKKRFNLNPFKNGLQMFRKGKTSKGKELDSNNVSL